jgi:phage pi2 protein 07
MLSPPIPNLLMISRILGHPSLKEFLHVKSGGMTYELTLNFLLWKLFSKYKIPMFLLIKCTVSDSLLSIVICR